MGCVNNSLLILLYSGETTWVACLLAFSSGCRFLGSCGFVGVLCVCVMGRTDAASSRALFPSLRDVR